VATPTIREVVSAAAAGANATASTGAGTQVGDLLVCFAGNDWNQAANLGPPTGTSGTWTLRATGDGGTNAPHLKIYTRFVTSGGVQTVTVSPSPDGEEVFTHVFVLADTDAATPVDGTPAGGNGAASTSHVAPATAPATADALLLCGAQGAGTPGGTGAYTPPSGMTERTDITDGGFARSSTASLVLTSSGTTGTKTFTGPNVAWATATIAVEGASGGPPLPTVTTAGEVDFVAASTPTPVGTTTTASTVSITPTLPAGTAPEDRVFVIQAGNNTSGATPAGWTAAAKDVQVGPTGAAPGAGTGRRHLSAYYRDYDGAWTMPAFTLTSATQNTHALSAITLRKVAGAAWDTPTVSTAGNTAAAAAAYSVTTGSLAAPNGMVLVGTATNDNVTASAQSLTGAAATFANLTERSDTGSATGNDVSIKTYTADVQSGGTGTITHAATLSAASEGGSIVVAQTSTASAPIFWPHEHGPQYRR